MLQDRWHIPTSDEEIVGVFLTETQDLADTINNHLKLLKRDREDKKALTEIRRCFHTLKGSGRMVKALDLSELAWKVENVLNQAIAGSIPVSESVVTLVSSARAQLPRLVTAFRQRRSIARNADIERLMKLADDLAEGKTPSPATVVALRPRTQAPSGVGELRVSVDRCMQRADEALHRSEMALQQTRRVSALAEAANWGHGQPNLSAEIERLGGLLQSLSAEVAELRRAPARSALEPVLSWTDVNRLVDARTRQALSAARLRSRVEQTLEDHDRAEAAHRFNWQSLIVSALVGGLVAIGVLFSVLPSGDDQPSSSLLAETLH